MGDKRHAPAALPPGKARCPLYRRLGGPQGQSGRVPKISPPPPGFDARTVQLVASRYTDWAMPASILNGTRCCEWVTRVRTKYGNTGLCLRKATDPVPETPAFQFCFGEQNLDIEWLHPRIVGKLHDCRKTHTKKAQGCPIQSKAAVRKTQNNREELTSTHANWKFDLQRSSNVNYIQKKKNSDTVIWNKLRVSEKTNALHFFYQPWTKINGT